MSNTILITGGGSGIGLGLAKEFLKRGDTVIIAGRQQERLEAACAANPGMHSAPLNITDAEGIVRFAKEVVTKFPTLNMLINNAGLQTMENLVENADPAVAESVIATNLLGPIRLTMALLPQLLAQPRASIINVTSALAFVPFARSPSYCASKSALHSYSMSLRRQLRDTNITVTELIPPYVQTTMLGEWQAEDPAAMPLAAFLEETMEIYNRDPGAAENRVTIVDYERLAEREGRFDVAYEAVNSMLG